jgi:hypothetical protein
VKVKFPNSDKKLALEVTGEIEAQPGSDLMFVDSAKTYSSHPLVELLQIVAIQHSASNLDWKDVYVNGSSMDQWMKKYLVTYLCRRILDAEECESVFPRVKDGIWTFRREIAKSEWQGSEDSIPAGNLDTVHIGNCITARKSFQTKTGFIQKSSSFSVGFTGMSGKNHVIVTATHGLYSGIISPAPNKIDQLEGTSCYIGGSDIILITDLSTLKPDIAVLKTGTNLLCHGTIPNLDCRAGQGKKPCRKTWRIDYDEIPEGATVFKLGAITGLTVGTWGGIGESKKLGAIVEINSPQPFPFSLSGDSGSLYYTRIKGLVVPLAIHCSVIPRSSIRSTTATPWTYYGAQLNKIHIKFCTCEGPDHNDLGN